MITGKYGKPIPPPGCIWEREPIILYSELAEAYDKGWAVFESFTSDSLGREVTSQFTLERVWNAMGGGRRFVCEQPVNVMSPPQGLKPFPNKNMVYIGKGPLPEDKQTLSEDEDPLWLYLNPILSGWDQCWYSGDSETAHYAVDPTTQYAREHWPEHVAAWERAREEERNLISQEQLRKKWQKRMGGDAIMYPSDSIITLTSSTYKDPTRVPEGVEPLPEGYTWAYFGPGPLPKDAQFVGVSHSGDKLMACMPDASIPTFKYWKTGDFGGMQSDHHYAVNVTTVYARQHFPELVENMRIKRALDKLDRHIHEASQQYIGQQLTKQLEDSMVRELISFVPKAPTPLGCGVGSGYNCIIPSRNIGKTMFAHKQYDVLQMIKAREQNKSKYELLIEQYPLEKPRFQWCDQGAPKVTAETIKLPPRPEGMPDHLIYLGEGPLPHERQRLTKWEYKYCHGLYGLRIGRDSVSQFGRCLMECNGAFKGWHYALDPHSTYAYKYWPELYLGAKPEKEPLTAQIVAEASCLELSPGSNLAYRIADNLNKRLE